MAREDLLVEVEHSSRRRREGQRCRRLVAGIRFDFDFVVRAHTLTGICNPLLRELVADRNLLIALECKVVYVDDTPGNSSL